MAAPSSTPSLSSRRGARKKATERIPQGQLIFYGLVFLLLGFLCLLVSDDELLANGESFFDLTPSPPAISYIDLNQTTNVSCGVHSAISCAECPQGNGQSWCNGECAWCYPKQECMPKKELCSTVTTKPQVALMTPENNPSLFTDTFCDFQGKNEWYPDKNSLNDWQLRTPLFIVGGAKKCATTSLFWYLAQHDRLQGARQKELLLFLRDHFPHVDNVTGKVLVENTRAQMYKHDYDARLMQQNTSLYAFEATPGYLFESTTAPKYILCAAPWVKFVFILRNPVDRVWSNYNFYLSLGVDLGPFDEWVQHDMQLLTKVGMLPENRHSDEFVGSKEEYVAWHLYLQRCNESVGRSMYIVQLLHWYQALRAIGRDPAQNILVVRNEDLKRDPQATVDRITTWLGVAPHTLEPEKTKEFMVSKYDAGEMTNQTKNMLQDFFRPYNERLYNLLEREEWQNVWE